VKNRADDSAKGEKGSGGKPAEIETIFSLITKTKSLLNLSGLGSLVRLTTEEP